MAGWGGFTDEELRKLKGEGTERGHSKSVGPKRNNRNYKQGFQGKRHVKSMAGSTPSIAEEEENIGLPPEQRLSSPKIKSQTNKARAQNEGENVPEIENQNRGRTVNDVSDNSPTAEKESPEKEVVDDPKSNQEAPDELNDEQIQMKEMSTMEKFQQQQKQMEELNKQKRAMLATAIQQRRKKAVAEASKLNKLHKELDKLDELLTEDVSRIRDRIENVSRDYLEAQKRYERAEKEFIEAKIDLHSKEELKESLTEHLYTVIHHNEVRKSKKLAELMEQLDMEEAAELSNMPITLPELPVFNTSVIRNPKSPTSTDPPLKTQEENSSSSQSTDTCPANGDVFSVKGEKPSEKAEETTITSIIDDASSPSTELLNETKTDSETTQQTESKSANDADNKEMNLPAGECKC